MTPSHSPKDRKHTSSSIEPRDGILSDSAMIARALDTEPLSNQQQRALMQEYRVGALAIRAELVQMPLALELLATQRFAYGSLSNRDKILTAIERTEKLWGRGTDSLSWEQRYTKQISTNATLATEAIEEITSISHEPYADVLRIEKQLQERLIGAAQESGSSRGQRTAENRIRLPFARIKSSADTVVSQVETITPIQHQMVTSNLRLVANRLKDRLKMNISDPLFAKYLNVGAQGLIAAIQRFNPDKKSSFSTYAVEWIDNLILVEARNEAFIRVPEKVRALLRRARETGEQLQSERGSPSNPEEVQARLNIKGSEAKELKVVQTQQRISSGASSTSPWQEVEHLASLAISPGSTEAQLAKDELVNLLHTAATRLFEDKLLEVMLLEYFGPMAAAYGAAPGRAKKSIRSPDIDRCSWRILRKRGEDQLTDYAILSSIPVKERERALANVLTTPERVVILNLLGPNYAPEIPKVEQANVLLKATHSLLLIRNGEEGFRSLAQETGLAVRHEEVLHLKLFGPVISWHQLGRKIAAASTAQGASLNAAQAHARFVAALRHLAPHLRQQWREQSLR